MLERASGILLPVFSLPGPYGIGTLGQPARQFVDFLARAGQRWWQILPLGPVGAGNSPYMSPSAFAGNPLLLDLEALAQDGLLTQAELERARLPEQIDRVDYARLRACRCWSWPGPAGHSRTGRTVRTGWPPGANGPRSVPCMARPTPASMNFWNISLSGSGRS